MRSISIPSISRIYCPGPPPDSIGATAPYLFIFRRSTGCHRLFPSMSSYRVVNSVLNYVLFCCCLQLPSAHSNSICTFQTASVEVQIPEWLPKINPTPASRLRRSPHHCPMWQARISYFCSHEILSFQKQGGYNRITLLPPWKRRRRLRKPPD